MGLWRKVPQSWPPVDASWRIVSGVPSLLVPSGWRNTQGILHTAERLSGRKYGCPIKKAAPSRANVSDEAASAVSEKKTLKIHGLLGLVDGLFDFILDLAQGAFFSSFVEGFEELNLFGRELRRGDHPDFHKHVATLFVPDIGQALTADAQKLSALYSFGNGEGKGAVNARDSDLVAQGGLGKADGTGIDKILSLALVLVALLHIENNEKIAVGASVQTAFAFAPDAQTRSRVDAGGNLNGQLLARLDDAFTVAFGAGMTDNLPRSVAVGAGGGYGEEALRAVHLSTAVAGGAYLWL